MLFFWLLLLSVSIIIFPLLLSVSECVQTETVVVSCQRNLAFAGGVVPSGGVEVWTLETMAVNWLGKGVCFLSSLGGGVGWSQRVPDF